MGGNVRPDVYFSASLLGSSSGSSSLSRFLRHNLPNTNYTVSNPCMSLSRSLIIPSLFHVEILCSSPPSRLANLSSSLLALPHPTPSPVPRTRGPSSSSSSVLSTSRRPFHLPPFLSFLVVFLPHALWYRFIEFIQLNSAVCDDDDDDEGRWPSFPWATFLAQSNSVSHCCLFR